ncbi:MAG: hypothetical protein IJ748_03610 [Bacteroidales bacterium]|nr:hypothetical protein [Bacteroidales bacterium]
MQQKKTFGQEVVLPCIEESYDDEEYFKALGEASNINAQNARTGAFDAAKSMLLRRLGGLIQGVSEDYSRSVSGQSQQDKIQRLIETDMNTIVVKCINDAQKTCEKIFQDDAGNYNSFITIKVSKKEMINKITKSLSQNEELNIEFNREEFRKYAEDRIKNFKQE